MIIFEDGFGKDVFFKKHLAPNKKLQKHFKNDVETFRNLPRSKQDMLKNALLEAIDSKLLRIKEVLAEDIDDKKKGLQIRGAIIAIKNAIESIPYTINSKHNTYTKQKKKILETLEGVAKGRQLAILKSLFALTAQEQADRNNKQTKKRVDNNFNTTTVKEKFIEQKFKPFAVKLLDSSNLSDLILAMLMITGRRVAEVVQTMKLDFSEYKTTGYATFTGQKKKNSDDFSDPVKIPLLINPEDVSHFKKRYTFFREYISKKITTKGVKIVDLDYRDFSNWAGSIRKAFKTDKYHVITSKIGDQVKSLRALYACYMLHSDKNRVKNKLGVSAYMSSILGHEKNSVAHLNYDTYGVEAMLSKEYDSFYKIEKENNEKEKVHRAKSQRSKNKDN